MFNRNLLSESNSAFISSSIFNFLCVKYKLGKINECSITYFESEEGLAYVKDYFSLFFNKNISGIAGYILNVPIRFDFMKIKFSTSELECHFEKIFTFYKTIRESYWTDEKPILIAATLDLRFINKFTEMTNILFYNYINLISLIKNSPIDYVKIVYKETNNNLIELLEATKNLNISFAIFQHIDEEHEISRKNLHLSINKLNKSVTHPPIYYGIIIKNCNYKELFEIIRDNRIKSIYLLNTSFAMVDSAYNPEIFRYCVENLIDIG